MQDHSHRKHITDRLTLCRHILNVDYLGSDKAGSAAPHKKILLFIGVGRQSKVAQSHFAGPFLSEHNIFGFEVPVNHAVG